MLDTTNCLDTATAWIDEKFMLSCYFREAFLYCTLNISKSVSRDFRALDEIRRESRHHEENILVGVTIVMADIVVSHPFFISQVLAVHDRVPAHLRLHHLGRDPQVCCRREQQRNVQVRDRLEY